MVIALFVFAVCICVGMLIGCYFYISSLERINQEVRCAYNKELSNTARWFNKYMKLKQNRDSKGRFIKGVK